MNPYELTMLDEIYASCIRYWIAKGYEEEQAKQQALADVGRMNNRDLLIIKGFYIGAIEFWEATGLSEVEAERMAFSDIERITIRAIIPVFPLPISETARLLFIKHNT